MKDRLKRAINGLTKAVLKPDGQEAMPVPKGWLTIQEMQKHYNHRWRHTTSYRATCMARRGLLDRKLILRKSAAMHYREYIYRVLPPCKSLAAADLKYLGVGQDKVPKGWATAKQLAQSFKISQQAIWQMAQRHDVPSRFYRTQRGLSGVVSTRHFQIGPMLRLHDKR